MISPTHTLGDVIKHYSNSRALATATAEAHVATLRTFTSKLVDKPVSSITADDVVFERDRQLRTGLAQSTVSRRIRSLKAWLRFAAEQGVELDGSVLTVKTPRNTSKQRDVDPGLVDRVWAEYRAKPDAYLGAWLLAYHIGGARVTDVLLLTSDKVDEGRITYTSSKTSVNCSVKITEPIALLLHRHATGDRLHGVRLRDWVDESGKRRAIGSATSKINNALKARGLGCSTHDARRCVAFKLVSKGVDVDAVKRICGWRSSAIALHYVAQVKRDDLDDVLGLL